MADETQVRDPVTVIDHDVDIGTYQGCVIITVASCFSNFAMTFNVSRMSTLKSVKKSFGKCADWHLGGLKYLYNGKLVQDPDTPTRLRLKNGDTTHVLAEAKFIASCSQYRRPEFTGDGFELLSVTYAEDSMVIMVEAYIEKYRIKPTTDLAKVTSHFCKTRQDKKLRFLYEGDQILVGDTPANSEMEDGDTIEAFREQIGD